VASHLRVLIAGDAAGPDDGAAAVLARFNLTGVVRMNDLGAAIRRMRDEQFDLVVLPVQDIPPHQFLALEREIRNGRNTGVIGTAPSSDPELILRAMRAGIHEFLVHPPAPAELAGAVERLMRRLRSDATRGELVAVYSAKGGLGSTTIAVNLAQAFASARPDARVALADLEVAGGDVRVFLNLKQTYDLGDLIAKGNKVDAELLNSLLTPTAGGVWALPTGDDPELEEVFDAAAIGSIMEMLRSHFAVTLVDCEHHFSERTLSALDAADRILLATHLTVPSLRSTQRSLGICRRLGYDESKVCVVVNRYQSGDVLPLKDAESLLQAQIYWTLPNDYRLCAQALNRGVPVSIQNPTAKLSRSYSELAIKLSGLAVAPHTMNGAKGESRLRRLFRREKGAENVT
jgi:pilus assembly protein CpaE